METYLIDRSAVKEVLDMKTCMESVETSFRLLGEKKVQMPPNSFLNFTDYGGDFGNMTVYVPELQVAGVKAASAHPKNYKVNLPTVMALIVLYDPSCGFPIAVLDGTYITNMRTGAGGGVAAKYLANKKIETVGFVGAGRQAMFQVMADKLVHPEIKKVKAYDISEEHALIFKDYCKINFDLEVEIVDSVDKAVTGCGIVNTVTGSRKALFNDSVVSPGTHINAIGSDIEGKQEFSSSILKKAVVIIDDWVEASRSGEINVPLNMGEISRDDIRGEMGDLVVGKIKGRQSEDEITVYDSAGVAVKDIVIAWNVYNCLMKENQYRENLKKITFLN